MKYRTGSRVGRTIYKGSGPDDLVGVMDTRELAAQVVLALNTHEELVGALKAMRGAIMDSIANKLSLNNNKYDEVGHRVVDLINKVEGRE